ncbi:MAG TPA: helix-turn-helix domain-containing protein [Acidimicrobiales bacterium]
MVTPVEHDARGIVAPARGLTKFRLDRHPPSPAVGRFVDRYWIVTWDLRGDEPFTQQVLAHPVVNVVFGYDLNVTVHGVTTRITSRTLTDTGRVLGVMFRPAGFRPFFGRPLSTITDHALAAREVFGPSVDELAAAVEAAATQHEMVSLVDDYLRARVPETVQPSEETTAIAERVAADPTIARVDALAAAVGLSVRQLERRFADHVGASPKSVIRRYRLYEAAERARSGTPPDWAELARVLGYSDQAHLSREFAAAFGISPQRYARHCMGDAVPGLAG